MTSARKKTDYDSDSEESSEPSEENDNISEEEDLSGQSDKDDVEQPSTTVTDSSKNQNSKAKTELIKQYPVTFVCSTLSDFTAKEVGELSFEKDEMITVISIRKDGWWEAKNSDGIQGLVPATFLKIPDHVHTLISELMKPADTKETHLWSHLRRSFRKARAINTAIQTFGAIGLPLGFRESLLGTMLKEDNSYTAEAFLFPKLSESGLSFEDMQWETSLTSATKTSMQMKPLTTVIQKVIHLVALRQIIPPPTEYKVTSRHVHICLHDGNKVLSNIHTTRACWDKKNPKIWMFVSKISVDGSCLEEGQIFVRSNKSSATLGILFELCICYTKGDSDSPTEISCGWAFMRLFNDSGIPIKSKTKILRVHNSVPFTNYHDASSVSLNSLQKLMNRNKQPRMVVSISSPKRSSSQQICFLPSTLIGPASNIPLMALYRKSISDDLLQRASFDSIELIQSPFLSNFPQIFNEPDIIDFFRNVWAERLKHDKHHDLRLESKKLNAFRSTFMETVFLIMNSWSLYPYSIGNPTYNQERKVKLTKLMTAINGKSHGTLGLSAEMKYKPISVNMLSASIIK